jgi:hypothetical protein
VGVLGVVLALVALGTAGAAPIPVTKMAALGDSITSAWNNGDKWDLSWSTGTNQTVNSHRNRLGGSSVKQELAVPGSRWNSGNNDQTPPIFRGVVGQAEAVAADTQYVTILTGSADLCRSDASTFLRDGSEPGTEQNGIPTPAEYANTIRAALQVLVGKNANVRVLLASIPNWAQLAAPEFTNKPLMNLCPVLFGTGGATANPNGFFQRIQALNAAAAAACGQFANCRYDGGAVFNVNLSPSDLTTYDNFHLTASGQAKIADLAWPTAAALLEGGSGGGGGGGSTPPDLAVSGTATPASARVGDGVELRLQARLLSGTIATNVELRATLPAGLQFVSSQTDRGPGCTGTQTLTCNLDFLNAQASTGNVIVTVRPTTAGPKTVPLQLSASQTDTAAGNNSASVSITVAGPAANPRPTVTRVGTNLRTVQARRGASFVTLAAAVQARNARSMVVSVTPAGSASRLSMLRGSRVGATTAQRRVKSITTRPGTVRRQLTLRLGRTAVRTGRRYVIVVTVRNAVGSRTIRIPVRG